MRGRAPVPLQRIPPLRGLGVQEEAPARGAGLCTHTVESNSAGCIGSRRT